MVARLLKSGIVVTCAKAVGPGYVVITFTYVIKFQRPGLPIAFATTPR
jgi:hypothetical protein